jgi:hypothetical protein
MPGEGYKLHPCGHECLCKTCVAEDVKNQEDEEEGSRYVDHPCPLCREIVKSLEPMFDESNSDIPAKKNVLVLDDIFGDSDSHGPTHQNVSVFGDTFDESDIDIPTQKDVFGESDIDDEGEGSTSVPP